MDRQFSETFPTSLRREFVVFSSGVEGVVGMDGIASAEIDSIKSLDCSLIIGCVGCSSLVLLSGKPYEGKPHVRFDEGSMETG